VHVPTYIFPLLVRLVCFNVSGFPIVPVTMRCIGRGSRNGIISSGRVPVFIQGVKTPVYA
jgi:hypothetical protein